MPTPLLRAVQVSKRYPGVQALDRVSVEITAGSVHALMGENGAGKSTLGKVMAGLVTPDEGHLELEGAQVRFRGPLDAVSAGIGMVHQELLFCENLTVAENLCLDALPSKGPWVDREAMRGRARSWLDAIGADIAPEQPLGELPVSRQQLVAIAGGVGRGARVLLFDEPSSSLTQAETGRLLDLIRQLRARGVACVYVSHRLDEVFAVSDLVTVLRDGRHVETRPTADLSRGELVRLMVGRDVEDRRTQPLDGPAAVALRVQGLSSPRGLHDVSLEVREGEIVGLAGLVGAGRTEVVEALFGLDPNATGQVEVRGQPLALHNPGRALRQGLGLVPEDRKRHGLVFSLDSGQNITLPILDRLASFGWIRRSQEQGLVGTYLERLRVRAPGAHTPAQSLSGGNQQKLVLARWLAAQCRVLLVDEPTRGVDVGAKAEIYDLLRGLAHGGVAILLVSSELPELLALSHRVLVMRDGRLVSELSQDAANEESVMRDMAGV